VSLCLRERRKRERESVSVRERESVSVRERERERKREMGRVNTLACFPMSTFIRWFKKFETQRRNKKKIGRKNIFFVNWPNEIFKKKRKKKETKLKDETHLLAPYHLCSPIMGS
jgi:hypothetical protein